MVKFTSRTLWALAASAMGVVAGAAPSAQQYSLNDLGTLGGSYSAGYGINEAGVIAGTSYTAKDALLRPFVYSNGRMTDLGTLGGDAPLHLLPPHRERSDVRSNGSKIVSST